MRMFAHLFQSVRCPKCGVSAGLRCRNLTKKITRYEENGKKRIRYTALKVGNVHKQREWAYDKYVEEKHRREKEDGVTDRERQEMEEIREQLRAAQEANGIALVSA